MNRLGNIPWALSGSQAMKLYANKYGVPTRTPQNINIVVRRNNMARAFKILTGQNLTNRTIENHYKVGNLYNLLKANTNLAPSINKYVVINGIPVVTLESLLNYKRRTLKNYPQKNRIQTIEKNIRRLKRILRTRKTPNQVLSRSPSRTAARPRSRLPRMGSTTRSLFWLNYQSKKHEHCPGKPVWARGHRRHRTFEATQGFNIVLSNSYK